MHAGAAGAMSAARRNQQNHNFSAEIQQKRIQKELNLLKTDLPKDCIATSQNIENGIAVQVQLLRALIPEIPEGLRAAEFEIFLEGRFPFQQPKILCRTTFCYPTLADGRDLLQDVTKKPWTPSFTVCDLVLRLPAFVKEVVKVSRNGIDSMGFGTFHIGSVFNISHFRDMGDVGTFDVVELSKSNSQEPRYMIISESVILFLEPMKKNRDYGVLVSWATLPSLANIKRRRGDKSNITLNWKGIGNQDPFTQTLVVKNHAEECIEMISRSMQQLGVTVHKNEQKKAKSAIKEEEVSAEAVEKVNIDEIISSIEVYETNLQEVLSIEHVHGLMFLYQQAIEYYSAKANPEFDFYLNRMHSMLKRPDIQVILQSREDTKTDGKKPEDEESKRDEEEAAKEQSTLGTSTLSEVSTLGMSANFSESSDVNLENTEPSSSTNEEVSAVVVSEKKDEESVKVEKTKSESVERKVEEKSSTPKSEEKISQSTTIVKQEEVVETKEEEVEAPEDKKKEEGESSSEVKPEVTTEKEAETEVKEAEKEVEEKEEEAVEVKSETTTDKDVEEDHKEDALEKEGDDEDAEDSEKKDEDNKSEEEEEVVEKKDEEAGAEAEAEKEETEAKGEDSLTEVNSEKVDSDTKEEEKQEEKVEEASELKDEEKEDTATDAAADAEDNASGDHKEGQHEDAEKTEPAADDKKEESDKKAEDGDDQ